MIRALLLSSYGYRGFFPSFHTHENSALFSLSLIVVFAAGSASLSSDTTVLAPSVDTLVLSAVADYAGEQRVG